VFRNNFSCFVPAAQIVNAIIERRKHELCSRSFFETVVGVGLTDLLISCARPRAPRSDAARPLPRLTNALEEVICNGRDAVALKVIEEL
jgi:hypothetical protein